MGIDISDPNDPRLLSNGGYLGGYSDFVHPIEVGSHLYAENPFYGSPPRNASVAAATPSAAPPAPVASILAETIGLDPNAIASTTYGKIIPISTFGLGRIGGKLVYLSEQYTNASGQAVVDLIVSFGYPADLNGTRALHDIALDSNIYWTRTDGALASWLSYRFYGGNRDQAIDPLISDAFGSDALAFAGQMLLALDAVPLAYFNGKVPFVGCLIGDTTDGADPADGITIGDSFQRLMYSPFVGLTSDDYESVGAVDVLQGNLFTEMISPLDYMKRFKSAFTNLGILQSDKLRLFDRGNDVTVDLTLDATRLISGGQGAGPIGIAITEAMLLPSEKTMSYVDPGQDYLINTVRAKRPRDPFPTTASIGSSNIALSAIMSADAAIATVTLAAYQGEIAREKYILLAHPYAYALEPEDVIALPTDFGSLWGRVTKTTHGADWTVKIEAEAMYKCAFAITPSIDPIVTASSAAFSTRKLRTGYNGYCLRVRRASDDTERDIGFIDGYIDTASLLSFCATTDGFVTIWYDQGVHGRNFIQTAHDSQAQLVSSGALMTTINGKAALDRSFYYMLSASGYAPFSSTAYAASAVARARTGATAFSNANQGKHIFGSFSGFFGMSFSQAGAYANGPCMSFWRESGGGATLRSADAPYTFGTDAIFLGRFDAANAHPLRAYVNGGTPATNANADANTGGSDQMQLSINLSGTGQVFDGPIAELLFFNFDLSVAQANALGRNQNACWGPSWTAIVS